MRVKVSPMDNRPDSLQTVFPGHSRVIDVGTVFIFVKVQINGENKEIADGLSIAGLLEQLQIRPGRVVVERNREIVSRDTYDVIFLAEGDALEIVHFVGGG